MSTGVTIHNVLLNGQAGPRQNPADHPQSAPPATYRIPGGRTLDCEWSQWTFLIESLQGAPTSAYLNLTFEIGLSTANGDIQPQPSPGTYNFSYTDANPTWVPIRAADYPDLLPDGDFPPNVGIHTMAFPSLITRRIRGGINHRIRVDGLYSGGTNPAFIMTVHQTQRY